MKHFKDKLELDEEELYREAMTNAYLLITVIGAYFGGRSLEKVKK